MHAVSRTAERTPLVLLHGLGTGPGAWEPQRTVLGRDRTTVAPQLPPELRGALARVADEVDRFAGEPVDLCGLSFGGIVALLYASENPRRVRRLVVAAGLARLPPALRALQILLAAAFRALPSRSVAARLTEGVPEPHRTVAREEIRALNGRDAAHAMRGAARIDLREAARSLALPVLVLCGERDRLNMRLSRALADLVPDAELRTIPGAGHVANLDNEGAFTQLVQDFLDR